jgi:outer membrane protein assembly factor BamB
MNPRRTILFLLAALLLTSLMTAGVLAQTITLSPNSGPPTSKTGVSGQRFGQNEVVDIYFDTTDLALGVTDISGNFPAVTIKVPSSAMPALHWITAVGRHTGIAAQGRFIVQTNATMYHFLPTLRGVNPFENVLSPHTVGSIDLVWNYRTDNLACGSPAVVNGIVYVGSWDGNMYALNAGTGAKVWSYPTGSLVCSAPAVINGVVYFGDYSANLYALNASTGAKIWSYPTNSCGIFAGPIVVSGVLYQNTGCSGNFYAFDAATGAVKWEVNLDGADTGWTPAVWNGAVYVGNVSGNFYALDQNTGSTKWKHNYGGSLYLGASTVANGAVYFGTSSKTFFAVNATTGTTLWIYRAGGDLSNSAPAVVNGTVYFGTSDGVYALAGTTGQLKWKYMTTGGFPVTSVANGVVYSGSSPSTGINNFFALDANTGANLWNYASSGVTPVGSATIANGMVFATSDDGIGLPGHIYAFGPSYGTRAKWQTHRPDPKTLRPDYNLKFSQPVAK